MNRSDCAIKEDVALSLELVLDALPHCTMIVDSKHHIIMANRAIAQRTGLSPADLVGAFCPKVLHGVEGTFPGCPLEEAVRKGSPVEREVFLPETGRWMLSCMYPLRAKTHLGREVFLHTAQDITDLKDAELKASHRLQSQTLINGLLQFS
jgi:PAS domain S-box-containing protein